jgi:hypothetical protein
MCSGYNLGIVIPLCWLNLWRLQGPNNTALNLRVSCICYTYMRRLTTGIRSDKCAVARFSRANVIECTYTNLDSTVYPTTHLGYMVLLLGYKPVQHVTVLNTVSNCNTMVL